MTPTSPSRRDMRDGSELRGIMAGRRQRAGQDDGVCETQPRSTYEAVTRQMVRALTDEVRDVKHRVNQLLTLIVAAILLEVLMRLIGVSS